jgi:pseudaminic acid cytidylyltransferase
MKVAIIPARGGSKRIPRKNIKNFFGKPMIAWSIQAAKKSECFDYILVSTDDKEIAEIAIKYGARVPFLRPKYLSDDYAGTAEVIAHAIYWLQEKNIEVDLACCIYATAPYIVPTDLKKSLELIENSGAEYCFSATSYSFPIQRAFKITKSLRCKMFQKSMFYKRSQDLEEAYHDAGQFYWGTAKSWIDGVPFFSSESIPYVLPRYRVQDIDTQEDWTTAELMFPVVMKNNEK